MASQNLTVALTPEVIDSLRAESEKTSIPMSAIIRLALRDRWNAQEPAAA